VNEVGKKPVVLIWLKFALKHFFSAQELNSLRTVTTVVVARRVQFIDFKVKSKSSQESHSALQ